MKKFLSSILLLIPFVMNAQVYHPLVDTGAAWNEDLVGLDFFNYFVTDVTGRQVMIDGDTVIQGNQYSLLKFRKTYYYEYENEFPPYAVGGNSTDSLHLVGALREDSDKRVWFRSFPNSLYYPELSPYTDTLLYDFSLQVGDTFHLNSSSWAVVESIDSTQLLNGQWRKQFHFNPYACWATSRWIEGIGSDGGLFGNFFCPFESAPYLTCYRVSGEALFDQPYASSWFISESCDSVEILLSTENLNSLSFHFEISPNPASDLLSINFSSANNSSAQIKITDVLGRNLFSEEIKSNQPLQVSTKKFSGNTMLFVQLWQEGKLIGVKKVLIQ